MRRTCYDDDTMASIQTAEEKAAATLLLTVVFANHAGMTDVLEEPRIFYDGWSRDGKKILVNGQEVSIGALFRAASRLLVRAYSDSVGDPVERVQRHLRSNDE